MDNKQMLDKLRVCINCNSDCVIPFDWEAIESTPEWPEHWRVMLYCGECETFCEDIYSQNEVELYEEWLDECQDEIQRNLKQMERKNMQDWVERFSIMLDKDIVVPEDF